MESWFEFTKYRKKNLFYFQLFSIFANILLLVMPIYSLQIYGRVLTSQSIDTLIYIVMIVIFFVCIQSLMDYARQQILNNLSLVYDSTFDQVMLNSSITSSKNLIKQHQLAKTYISSPFHRHLADLPWTLIFTVVMFILHPYIGYYALISLITISLISGLSLYITYKKSSVFKKFATNQNILLSGILSKKNSSKLHLISEKATKKWKQKNERVLDLEYLTKGFSNKSQFIIKSFRMLVQVGIYALCAFLVIKGEIMSGSLLASSILLGRILAPVDQGTNHLFSWLEAKSAFEEVDLFLKEKKREENLKINIEAIDILVDKVTLNNSEGKPIIKNLGFNLKKGSALQVIGLSGSGKSTLLKICAGCVTPDEGGIRINGVSINKISQDSLTNKVSYLGQRPELIKTTLADNICGFETINENSEDILWASKAANCIPFISKLSNGFSTNVGSGEQYFSESEVQRIALAGALYKKPRLIILDEPTTSLDNQSKEIFLNTLIELKKSGSTIIFTSLDNDMSKLSDYIIEIKDGSLVKAFENKSSNSNSDSLVRHISSSTVKF
ncbi:ATP-binding cassette domain-containing protein [Vibrio viridaestus]|uniref:ATP-binding cassette domain-containing protein n=1 Tax=Vibrio viridaestus TaxID=2487322 RepID=A0A3N9THZ0_9VIBR|nr:ATP-binding cassette domain-containing protein [Vibrio viridaestus]RQW63897.1 ATP-binding cassette domain-containing protein [Vibrio viridaestus]